MNGKLYEDTVVKCPVAFYQAVSKDWDIRVLVRNNNASLDYLRGVQDVLNYIRYHTYKEDR